jgi:hypothetical protein
MWYPGNERISIYPTSPRVTNGLAHEQKNQNMQAPRYPGVVSQNLSDVVTLMLMVRPRLMSNGISGAPEYKRVVIPGGQT